MKAISKTEIEGLSANDLSRFMFYVSLEIERIRREATPATASIEDLDRLAAAREQARDLCGKLGQIGK